MDYVGLFCLGIFVGSIAVVGLQYMTSASKWKQGLTAIIVATLSGTAILFVDRYKSSPAVGAYPMGLLIALIWGYIYVATANMLHIDRKRKILGWLHLAGAVTATLLASALIFPFAWAAAVTAWKGIGK